MARIYAWGVPYRELTVITERDLIGFDSLQTLDVNSIYNNFAKFLVMSAVASHSLTQHAVNEGVSYRATDVYSNQVY